MQSNTRQVRSDVLASSHHGGIIKSNGQTAACDRCRGQKMKCVRDSGRTQCQRCQRVNATCVVPPPKTMGRPPRKDRSSKTSSPPTSSPPTSDSPDNITNAATADVLGDVETATMSTQTTAGSLDLWDCFADANVFDDFLLPDGLDIESPSCGTINSANSGYASYRSNNVSQSGIPFDSTEPQNSIATNLGNTATDHSSMMGQNSHDETSILTHLAELNVAILRHPLHQIKDSHDIRFRSTTTAELGVGKLLDLTKQLEVIIKRRRALEGNNPTDQTTQTQDRPLAIIALSCYANLNTLYQRGICLLQHIKDGSRKLQDPDALMPGFTIDGFQLDGCTNVKVALLINLFEQVLARLRNCVNLIDRPEAISAAS